MKSSWKTKGKRIGALLLTLLILAGALPYTNMGIVRAAGAGEDAGTDKDADSVTVNVTVKVTVKVPGADAAAEKTEYSQAVVTVTYPSPNDGQTRTVTAEAGAEAGTYRADCAGWTLQENESYMITVKPAEADSAAYNEYSQVYTVGADEAGGTSINVPEVILERKPTYSITVTGTENAGNVAIYDDDDGIDADGTDISEGEARTVTATPEAGYEITGVAVKADESEWTPDGEGDTWWMDCIDSESGAFQYRIESVTADYEFMITFSKKTFTITYTLGMNGKLTLNSGDSTNAIEIAAAAADAEQEVEYTNDEYVIKASVTDDTYHLTSFKVDGDEKITDADTANGANAVKEKEYVFSSGITEAHTIEVTAAINSYTVTVNKSGGGTVSQGEDTFENGSAIVVDSGNDVTFAITPAAGYKVAGITVNGAQTSPSDAECTVRADGSYLYKISSVESEQTISAEFEEITAVTDTFENAGLTLTNIKREEENVYYANTDSVLAADGKVLCLEGGTYQETVTFSENQSFSIVYLRDAVPSAFGTEQKIELTPEICIVVDKTKPEISLTDAEQEIWKNGNESNKTVDITGTAADENLDRVVWSASEMENSDDILKEETNAVKNFTESGKFTIAGLQLAEGADTDTFYLYAVDKADNISEAGEVTVYRDSAAPVITGAAAAPAPYQLSYGNFFNTAIKLTITAEDIATDEEGNTYHASGVKGVEIYAGDAESPAYAKEAADPATGSEGREFEVTIPIGGAFTELKDIRMKVTDQVGNVSREFRLTEFNDAGFLSDSLMLENNAPEVAIALPDTDVYKQQVGQEIYYWYKEIPAVSYSVTDKKDGENGSGLAARAISLNGTILDQLTKSDYGDASDHASVRQEESGTLTGEDLSVMPAGENTINIQFKDLAGNTGAASRKIYLDTHVPEITGFSIEKKSGTLDKVLNILPFGNFSNGAVVITVTADDVENTAGETFPSSGLKEITLCLDGTPYLSKTAEDGAAVFELPAEEILDEERGYLDKVVSAFVTDKVGNQSALCDMTTGNSDIADSSLMIETVKPTVTVDYGQGYVGEEGIAFNNADTEFTVKVSDADSGLYRVTISINGTVLTEEQFQTAAKEVQYVVNTKDAATTESGLYTMTTTIVDNAGNETTATNQVYKDETAPEILRFEMQAAGVSEADGENLSVVEMDYGYYFLEDTRVTIYAADGTRDGDSGVKEIRYYTVDANGTRSSVQTAAVDSEDKISFVIPAGFKGQIYACAYDQLLNCRENYVTPSSLIIETAEQHTREEHISFQKAAAPYTDKDGGELYANNVNVTVTVTDTFSGIRSVVWSVTAPYDTAANQSGAIEIDNNGAFAAGSDTDGWNKTRTEKNLVTELQKTLVVSNNSNDIVVHIQMTDRAGNTSEREIKFSIDQTAPTIEVTFDNETSDAEYAEMFKESRTATITVTERNFNAADISVLINSTDGAAQISDWQTAENGGNPDATTNTATVVFSEDGDYTMEISGRDMANNPAEPVSEEEFTIDKTLPVINVTYDNENALNGNYFAAGRTATIEIEEHNFSAERVKITGTATDGGAAISFPTASGFSSSGDIHTATIVCGTDGLYRFDVEYTDMAGNEAEMFTGEEYYVDMTEPEIEITGVENLSANNGDVVPKISLSDTNYDTNGVSIELAGANRGNVAPEGAYTAQANGQIYTFRNFPKEQSYDDIYTLTATLTDMAGNESTDTITFSVNRFGSVYVFDDSLKQIAGTYIQNEIDVKLTEVNVDSLEHDRIKVVLDANGTPTDLTEGTDYTVRESGGNGSWYQYDYTIDKSLFAGDGRYIVTLYSEDVAGNVNENIDETKEAEISFGVDKTAPVVIPIDIESDAQYPVDVKSATVTVNDNLVLENVEVYVGEEKCEYTAEGENYTFNVPSADARQDITVAATDAAGNRTNYVISGVLVTTNAFIRWYNNKPLFVGTIAGVAVVSGGCAGVIVVIGRRRSKIKKQK